MPEGETAHSTVQEEKEPIANLCDVDGAGEYVTIFILPELVRGKTFRNSESTISTIQLVTTEFSF